MLQNFNLSQMERVSIIRNWLGRQGLQLLETLKQAKQETCNDEGLFKTPNRKFKLQYNETIKSLQFLILVRQHNESMEEWRGRLRTAAMECNYKEVDRKLKEKFIHGLTDSEMLTCHKSSLKVMRI